MVKRFLFRTNSLSRKLTIANIALLFISLAVLGWSSYQSNTRIIKENQFALMENSIDQSNRSMDDLHSHLRTILLSISLDERLFTADDREVEQILDSYARYSEVIKSLYLIHEDGRIVGVPPVFVRTMGSRAYPLVIRFAKRNAGMWISDPYRSPISSWTVTVGMTLLNADGTRRGALAIDLPLETLRGKLPPMNLRIASTIFVIDSYNTPVISDPRSHLTGYNLLTNQFSQQTQAILNEQLSQKNWGVQEVLLNDNRYFMLVGKPNLFNWRTVFLFSDENINAANRQTARTLIPLMLAIGLASLVMAWFFARYFTRPLERLSIEMARVQIGQLQGIHVPRRADEIGQLAEAFDQMMERIRQLVGDLQASEKRKRQAEIQTLQAQIKPHFLYNTLNAIGHMAALGRTDDVYAMIQALTQMLSFALDTVNEQVRLAEEIAYIEQYIRLLRLRYGRDFQVVYDIAPGTGSYEVLKLSLLPLVENAIFHALAQCGDGGMLRIRANLEGDKLIIEVIDNGPGIPYEKIRALETENIAPPGSAGHMGLRNVKDRLLLHYGLNAAMTIDSEIASETVSGFTRVRICMPARMLKTPLDSGRLEM